MGAELISNHKWKANMKANNTKKREYIEPQIEYIVFAYADVVAATGDVDVGGDTGDDGNEKYDPWETGLE